MKKNSRTKHLVSNAVVDAGNEPGLDVLLAASGALGHAHEAVPNLDAAREHVRDAERSVDTAMAAARTARANYDALLARETRRLVIESRAAPSSRRTCSIEAIRSHTALYRRRVREARACGDESRLWGIVRGHIAWVQSLTTRSRRAAVRALYDDASIVA
jgi:hypothetical protein